VPRGTTAVVCDPHEIANVAGAAGVRWLLEAAEGLPLDVYAMAPSCVPASPLESAHAPLGPQEMAEILRHPRALGVAEMMNFPGVIAGDPGFLERRDGPGARHADDHAPGVTGRALDAYVAAGIRSDHESTTWQEALEERRRGMWVLIREASNARDLAALAELVRRHGPEHCAFCTDDREPDHLLAEGHIDHLCRLAVAEGIAPEDALLMATLHPARCHGLPNAGAIAPGYRADLVLLEDLEGFAARLVIKDGAVAARDGRAEPLPATPAPAWLRATMRHRPVTSADLRIPDPDGPARVIELVPGRLVTGAGEALPAVRDGVVVADPARDLAKLAVAERHHGTGRVGLGLVRGFGLRAGAFASTVAHDAHNLLVVGMDDADMARCAARLGELGGGLVVVRDGEVRGELPLPVAGLLSEVPVEEVAAGVTALQALLTEQGVGIEAPFMALSFLALSVIPALKLTDRGLVDVDAFAIVPLPADAPVPARGRLTGPPGPASSRHLHSSAREADGQGEALIRMRRVPLIASAPASTGRVIEGVITNRIGYGFSPFDRYGNVNAQAAVEAVR
jgi:adenine deaminase